MMQIVAPPLLMDIHVVINTRQPDGWGPTKIFELRPVAESIGPTVENIFGSSVATTIGPYGTEAGWAWKRCCIGLQDVEQKVLPDFESVPVIA